MIHCNPDQTDNRRWFFDSASLISTGPRARGCEEAVGRSALLGAFAAGTPKQSSKRNCRINDSLVQWWSIMCNLATVLHWSRPWMQEQCYLQRCQRICFTSFQMQDAGVASMISNRPEKRISVCYITSYYIILYYIMLNYIIFYYYIILYYIVFFYIILYNILLYYVILHYILLYSYYIISYHIYYAILYYIILYYIIYYIILYGIISYRIILYHIVSYYIILYYIISYHIILFYITWYYIIFLSYYIISYYIILHYMILNYIPIILYHIIFIIPYYFILYYMALYHIVSYYIILYHFILYILFFIIYYILYYDILTWYTIHAWNSVDACIYFQLNSRVARVARQHALLLDSGWDRRHRFHRAIHSHTLTPRQPGPLLALEQMSSQKLLKLCLEGGWDSAQTCYRWISDHPYQCLQHCNMLIHVITVHFGTY